MSIRLETERLILRPMEGEADVNAHVAMMQNPEIAAFLTPDGKPRNEGDEWRMAACMVGHWSIRGFGFFSMIEKASGEWVGRAGPWMPAGWPGLECGWGVKASHWGKGYAPEAAIAAIQWVFAKFPDLERIISVIDPANVNSQAVARKIGEAHKGEIFEFWGHKLDIWSADREAWLEKFGR